jgi:hypothetical protein
MMSKFSSSADGKSENSPISISWKHRSNGKHATSQNFCAKMPAHILVFATVHAQLYNEDQPNLSVKAQHPMNYNC